MGNRESLHLKEGKHILEIDEKILRDFQHCINVVDRTMTGFARSLDALRASCKLPVNNGDVKDVKLHEQPQGRQDNQTVFDPQLVADLHQTLYDCVTDHEYVHMESLSKLFSFVFSIGKDYIVFSQAEPFSFSVDKYLIQQKEVDIENGKQYYDIRIGVLQKKIEDLKYALKIAEKDVDNLNKREGIYQEEKELLKSKIERLENNVEKMKSENDTACDENVELLTKIAERDDLVMSLKKSLQSLQNKLSDERENKCKVEVTLNDENEGYRRTINELQTAVSLKTDTIEELRDEIDALNTKYEKERKNTNDELEEYKSTVDKLQRNIDEMDTQVGELKKIRKENTELKQSLEEERESKQDVIKQMDEAQYSHSKEKEIIEKKVKSLKEENESLTENQAENKSEIEALELQIEMLKNKKVMHVQAFQPFQFSAPTAKEKLFTIIKNKMELKDIEFNVMQIGKPSQVDLNVPLILNCSRTTTTFKKDKTIASSLKEFPEVSKKMAVVIYHIKEEKDLKREVEMIDLEAGKDLGGVFNIGYKNKIYRCPTNANTIDGVVDFLLKEGDVRYKVSGESAP